jgi:hypothetical protein
LRAELHVLTVGVLWTMSWEKTSWLTGRRRTLCDRHPAGDCGDDHAMATMPKPKMSQAEKRVRVTRAQVSKDARRGVVSESTNRVKTRVSVDSVRSLRSIRG